MSLRRLMLTAVLLALATACTPGGGGGPAEDDGPPGRYAYMKVVFGASWPDTKSTFVVMDGTKRIGSAELLLGGAPLYTADGRFAFTYAFIGGTITAISTETGAVSTLDCAGCLPVEDRCHCPMVVPIGGSAIAWLDADGRLVTADLAANPPTAVPSETLVPLEDGFLDDKLYPALLAGTEGAALAAYPDNHRPDDEPTPAYLVTPGAEPRRLDTGRKDAMETAAFSPDGTEVAIAGEMAYTCATVTVVDLASGKGTSSPLRAAPGEKCEDHDAYIDGLWWDPDGTLNAYYQTGEDDQGGDDVHARFDGSGWAPAGVDLNRRTHLLAGGTAAVLDDWSLSLAGDGKTVPIDTEVRYLTAAPA